MKQILYSLILFTGIQTYAAEPIKVKPDLKQSVVYLKGAVLKHKASASIPAGNSSLVFTDLSHDVLRESIRIKPEGCQILSVSLKKNFMGIEQANEELKAWQEELAALREKNEDALNVLDVYEQEKQLILANKNLAGKENGLDPEKLKATADFYRLRLADILKNTQAVHSDMDKRSKRMLELERQINQSASKNIYPTSEIEVSLKADKATQAQFELEYYITEAGWFPTYDFRVNDLKSPMKIDYVAQIYQNSGLDWKNIDITVSSADPGNNGGLPTAQPWYISSSNYRLQYGMQQPKTEISKINGRVTDAMGKPIPYARIQVENSSVGTTTDYNGSYSLSLPLGAQRVEVSAVGYEQQSRYISLGQMNIVLSSNVADKNKLEVLDVVPGVNSVDSELSLRGSRADALVFIDGVKTRGRSSLITESNVTTSTSAVSVEYTLKEKMSVPSDGRPYTSAILTREIDADYKHFSIPKLSKDVYLNLSIPEWEKLNLLEGEVNLYFADSYTGKSIISLRDLKDSLSFSMGKDPNVKIQRSLSYQKTTGGVLASKTSSYRWTTELRNVSTNTVKIHITEPFPVSTEKEVKVELDKELSNATVDKEKGLMSWDIELQPGEQKKLEFGFSVSYPKNITMRFE